MTYLVGQIFVIILLGTCLGLALGWWSRGLMLDDMPTESPLPSSNDTELDPFGARSRLEQCHRDNASLRRELNEANSQLEAYQKAGELTQQGDMFEQLQEAEARIRALMDDLQARDDTIAVLEQELERGRS